MERLDYLLKTLFVLLFSVSVVVLTGCSDDEDGGTTTTSETTDETTTDEAPTQTLAQLLSADEDYSTLLGYLEDNPTLAGIIAGSTEHTFFAPKNSAFTDLEAILQAELSIVREDIVFAVLAFHASTTIADATAVAGELSLTSLQGEDIGIASTGLFTTAGSSVDGTVETSTQATNGWLHKVNKILIPPTIFQSIGLNLGKLSQVVLLGADFTTLAAAIGKSDAYAEENNLLSISEILTYEDNLSNDEGEADTLFTFFLPSNATFEAVSIDTATYTAEQWYGIISNHIVVGTKSAEDDGIITSSELVQCAQFTSMAGASLQIFNNTEVVAADNGIGIYIDSDSDIVCDLSDMGASLAAGLDAEIVLQDDEGQATGNGAYIVIAGVLAPPQQ